MSRIWAYTTAFNGSVLLSVTLGILMLLIVFFAEFAIEGLFESLGLLAQGWGQAHFEIMLDIAALTTLPLCIAMFITTWKKILAVELAA